MNRLMMAAVGLLLAAPLAAQGPGRMGPPPGPPTMDELATRLKLTTAQRAEIAPLHEAHLKEMEPFRATARSEMAAARAARQGSQPAESVAVHRAKAEEAMKAIRERSLKWQGQLEAKLTPEQQAEWNRWEQERRAQMRERRPGRDGGRRAAPPS